MPQPTETWGCTRCRKAVPIEDVFVLREAGPALSLKPLCEPCADFLLAKYQANPQLLAVTPPQMVMA